MKRLLLGIFLFCLLGMAAQAQLSSTECLTEVQKVYAQIDHQLLMVANGQTRLAFKHTYIMRLDPEGKTIVMEETKTFGSQFYRHQCDEFTDASDATEGFSFHPMQFLVYRTKPTLAKAAVLPETDKGVFATCTVKECEFVPIQGNDTLRYKRAFMTLNDDGQKRYKLKDLEFLWNPRSGVLVSLIANFTEKSIWKWAKFEFQSIGTVIPAVATEIKSLLLDEAGELRSEFKGSDILDYR